MLNKFRPKVTDEMRLDIYEKYKSGKYNQIELAIKYGLCQTTIQRSISKAIKLQNEEPTRKPSVKLTRKDRELIKNDFEKNSLTIGQIKAKWNLSQATAYNIIYGKKKNENREEKDSTVVAQIKQSTQKRVYVTKVFNSVKVGSEVIIRYNISDVKEKTKERFYGVMVNHGIVIQKTDSLIVVQDIKRPYIKSDISKLDLISVMGGVRIQLVKEVSSQSE